ncbi:MAG TPA: EamA family transporter [Chitinophagaceae bacterium]|nr:EamA family transporter [Chitinophagaceae bacterium]
MNLNGSKKPGSLPVILAFITVYIVWGSTYFFISRALHGFPPFLLGGIRFVIAGLIMMTWAIWKKENLLDWATIKLAAFSGFFILFIGNGVVIFVEQYVGSAWVAIIISAAPLWYVVYDKPHWKENFNSKSILTGLFLGLIGIFLLFLPNISSSYKTDRNPYESVALFALIIGSMSWVVGSLFVKYKKTPAPASVNTSWQMFFAGLYFFIGAGFTSEYHTFQLRAVSMDAWFSLAYLVIFGSILAYSCFVWLMEVRSPAEVSTYAYVNPVVAVLLGVFLASEHVNLLQVAGLLVILLSVLLINLNKYLKRPRLA